MGKEIERKWLCKPTEELKTWLQTNCGKVISDYYFNEYTRLRKCDGEWCLTVKSLGNEIREEFEFPIDSADIHFLPSPQLTKKRLKYNYMGHTFEINVFRDIYMTVDDKIKTNLIMAEVEFSELGEPIALPDFIAREVTNNSGFYGHELFKRVKDKSESLVVLE